MCNYLLVFIFDILIIFLNTFFKDLVLPAHSFSVHDKITDIGFFDLLSKDFKSKTTYFISSIVFMLLFSQVVVSSSLDWSIAFAQYLFLGNLLSIPDFVLNSPFIKIPNFLTILICINF